MVNDSAHPSVLEARNIDAIARYVKKHNVHKIVIMVGEIPMPPIQRS